MTITFRVCRPIFGGACYEPLEGSPVTTDYAEAINWLKDAKAGEVDRNKTRTLGYSVVVGVPSDETRAMGRQQFRDELRAIMRGEHVEGWQAQDMIREITEWHDSKK